MGPGEAKAEIGKAGKRETKKQKEEIGVTCRKRAHKAQTILTTKYAKYAKKGTRAKTEIPKPDSRNLRSEVGGCEKAQKAEKHF